MLKFIKFIWSMIRTILSIILVALLAIIITQRVSNNKMAVAGFRIFTVVTESMVPEYLVGDAIFTQAIDPSEIKVGDDVTYLGMAESFKDRIVTHRVISIEKAEDGQYIFQTKGIANDKEDPKINGSQIYGKVIYKIKSISYLNGIIGNLYGMYFAIFIPFGLIMFIEYIGYRRDKREELEEELEETEDKNEKISEDDLKEKRKERRRKRRKRRNKNKE